MGFIIWAGKCHRTGFSIFWPVPNRLTIAVTECIAIWPAAVFANSRVFAGCCSAYMDMFTDIDITISTDRKLLILIKVYSGIIGWFHAIAEMLCLRAFCVIVYLKFHKLSVGGCNAKRSSCPSGAVQIKTAFCGCFWVSNIKVFCYNRPIRRIARCE